MASDINLPHAFAKPELFLNNLIMMIVSFACSYDVFLIMGDFNMETSDPFLTSFCDNNSLRNLIKNSICFKGIGSCIDLILTNRKYSFKNVMPFETGLGDHHHAIYTMLKSFFINEEPNSLNYRVYETFSYENVKGDLSNALHILHIYH